MLTIAMLPCALAAQEAGSIRIATFAAPLSRDGPGLLLRDIIKGDDAQIIATAAVIDHVAPDILVLTDIDYDATGAALSAYVATLADPFPYHFIEAPNAGKQTGLDLDGDGFAGDEHDALGYGRFFGDGGIAVLSRWPVDEAAVQDLTPTLWRDLPGAELPMVGGALWPTEVLYDSLPVSSTAHWVVPINVGGITISLMASDATPPVFDGDEDFNGMRNRDELRLWEVVLDGHFGTVPQNPVVIGNLNLDPFDGEGLQADLQSFLMRPDVQDPRPMSAGGQLAADVGHSGDPRLDTVDWPDGRPGNLRVSYVLPAADMTVTGAGVFWPAPDDPLAALLGSDGLAAGPHRLVWVDIAR